MPAKSKAQQNLFGIARAIQSGEMKPSQAGGAAQKIAKTVSKSDVKDFASTPSKNLPMKVKKETYTRLKEILRPLVHKLIKGDKVDESRHIPSCKPGSDQVGCKCPCHKNKVDESKASDDAKKQGLENMGFGRYGKNGKQTHAVAYDRLVPFKGNKEDDVTGPGSVLGVKKTELQKVEEALGRQLTVPEKHQLAIAYKTMKMPDAMVGVMGGMNKEQAKQIIKQLTGKEYKERANEEVGDKEYNAVSKEAKAKGLIYLGFGRYGTKKGGRDSVTHTSVNGKLVPFEKDGSIPKSALSKKESIGVDAELKKEKNAENTVNALLDKGWHGIAIINRLKYDGLEDEQAKQIYYRVFDARPKKIKEASNETHIEHAKKVKPARPCTANDAKIGGGCFNCGYEPIKLTEAFSQDTIEAVGNVVDKNNRSNSRDIFAIVKKKYATKIKGIGDDELLSYIEHLIKTDNEKKKLSESARSLSQIAYDISKDWKGVNYAARPYLEAMKTLNSITDSYGQDSGSSVVAYFLSNASSWKGETAKKIKKELNDMLKMRETYNPVTDKNNYMKKHKYGFSPGGNTVDSSVPFSGASVGEAVSAKPSTLVKSIQDDGLKAGNVWVVTKKNSIEQVSKEHFNAHKDDYKAGPFSNHGMASKYMNEGIIRTIVKEVMHESRMSNLAIVIDDAIAEVGHDINKIVKVVKSDKKYANINDKDLLDLIKSHVKSSTTLPRPPGSVEFKENVERRWVYGTKDNQWHMVTKEDRDFEHGITFDEMKKLGREKAKEKYLSAHRI